MMLKATLFLVALIILLQNLQTSLCQLKELEKNGKILVSTNRAVRILTLLGKMKSLPEVLLIFKTPTSTLPQRFSILHHRLAVFQSEDVSLVMGGLVMMMRMMMISYTSRQQKVSVLHPGNQEA